MARNKSKVQSRPAATEQQQANLLHKCEWAAAIALTVLSLALHLQNLFHAGPLWRDEVNSVNIAAMPSLKEIFRSLPFESFPALYLLVLKCWMALGMTSDFALRLFGFLVGIGTLAGIWFTGLSVNRSVPLLALALIGFNSVMLQWGDSLRAYGSGSMLIMVTFGAMWRLTQSPTRLNILLAIAAALLSVQCIYYNSMLLFALVVAGGIVAWRNVGIKRAALIGSVGALAVVTMAIYIPAIREVKSWHMFEVPGLGFNWYFEKFTGVLENSGKFLSTIWIALFALAIVCALLAQRKKLMPNPAQRDAALFALIALAIATPAYFLFLKNLNYATNPWYYAALMGFAAVGIDAALSSFMTRKFFRVGRLIVIALIVSLSFSAMWKTSRTRFTTVDTVASTLHSQAAREDAIIVTKWYFGISFERYFHGPNSWLTIPAMDDHKTHRSDLAKQQMTLPDQQEVVRPAIESIAHALQSGHKAWLIGGLNFLKPGEAPLIVPPAPQLPSGWYGEPYERSWSQQVAHFIQTHATRIDQVTLPETGPVNPLENISLIVVEGWRQQNP